MRMLLPGEPEINKVRMELATRPGNARRMARLTIREFSRKWEEWSEGVPLEWIEFTMRRAARSLTEADLQTFRNAWAIPDVSDLRQWEDDGGPALSPTTMCLNRA